VSWQLAAKRKRRRITHNPHNSEPQVEIVSGPEHTAFSSGAATRYSWLLEMLTDEDSRLKNQMPPVDVLADEINDADAAQYARQATEVLTTIRKRRKIEAQEFVRAKDLAWYFFTSVPTMSVRLHRLHKKFEECRIERPEKLLRKRSDACLYRTKFVIEELKRKMKR
jgi:hypothetical protein